MSISGDTLFAVGAFSHIGGADRNHAAALSLSTGQATTWNPDPSDIAFSVCSGADAVYIGGAFTLLGAQTRHNLAAIDSATGAVLPWNPAPSSAVFDLLKRGNSLFVAGGFQVIEGVGTTLSGGVRSDDGLIDELESGSQ